MGAGQGYRSSECLDLTGTPGDAMKTELRPKQSARILGVGGEYLSLYDLATSIYSDTHTGLEGLHASI